MKFALFLGCRIPAHLPEYATSMRAVLGRLGVELVELGFTCCGYPARESSREGFVFAAASNLALAAQAGLPILTPCECCFGALRLALRCMREDLRMCASVTQALREQGLEWGAAPRVEHLLRFLASDFGADALRSAVCRPRSRLKVAAHYGCHALRPGDVTGRGDTRAPETFEALIDATGAQPVVWQRRLECCGDPSHAANPPLALSMTEAKIASALEAGADALCTACPHCELRFRAAQDGEQAPRLATLLYTQLLGLAMGMEREELGLSERFAD